MRPLLMKMLHKIVHSVFNTILNVAGDSTFYNNLKGKQKKNIIKTIKTSNIQSVSK
jgi:hypothetical protein